MLKYICAQLCNANMDFIRIWIFNMAKHVIITILKCKIQMVVVTIVCMYDSNEQKNNYSKNKNIIIHRKK